MVFVGATRYRVATDFLIALLAAAARSSGRSASGASAGEGHARSPDRRDRRFRAPSPDAAARTRRARRRRQLPRARRPVARAGSVLRGARRFRTNGCRARGISMSARARACVARSGRRIVVHTHLVHADVYGALGAATRSCRRSTTTTRFAPGRSGYVERALARRAAKIIAITSALARFQVERVGLPAEKVEVVHYGLDDLPAPWGTNALGPVPADARVLLASAPRAAEGRRRRGASVPRIRASHPKAVLVVLGEGPQRAELSAACAELDVPVHLLGRVPDVADLAPACRAPRPSGALGGIRSRTARGDARRRSPSSRRMSARSRRSSSDGETGLLVGPGRSGRACASGEPRARRTRRSTASEGRTRAGRVQRREDDEPDLGIYETALGADRSSGLTQLQVTGDVPRKASPAECQVAHSDGFQQDTCQGLSLNVSGSAASAPS